MTLRKAAGLLGGLCLALALLLGFTWLLGSDGNLLGRLMLRSAPPETTGLPEAEYLPVGRMTGAYLREQTPDFQHRFRYKDAEYLCFNATEQAHMADCRTLFRRCRQVCLLLLCAGLALCPAGRRGRWPALGVLAALGLGLLLLCAALVDFDGLFVQFHRLAFTNLLWILDPAVSLLIRLMPTPFFIRCAALIGGAWLAACLALALVLDRIGRHGKNANRDSKA